MNRRDFFERLAGLAGGTAAATALLAVLENNYARAALVPEDDPSIRAEMTEIAPGIKAIWCARRRKEPIRPYS